MELNSNDTKFSASIAAITGVSHYFLEMTKDDFFQRLIESSIVAIVCAALGVCVRHIVFKIINKK